MTQGRENGGLKGRLEDLPLLDILQIVAFSKKTGYLSVEGPLGRGAVLFKNGRVLCAYSWSTLSYLRQLAAGQYTGDLLALLQQHVEVTFRELMTMREGAFLFRLTDDRTVKLSGVDVVPFLEHDGFDPQHLLLDTAKEMDEEREDTVIFVGTEPRPPAHMRPTSQTTPEPVPAPPEIARQSQERQKAQNSQEAEQSGQSGQAQPVRSAEPAQDSPPDEQSTAMQSEMVVVLVDDESEVTDVVGEELRARRLRVEIASNPDEGEALVRKLLTAGDRVVLVSDLRMPSASGRSFYGGFELVRRLRNSRLELPILLMTDRLPEKARERAKELGVRKVAFKPTISKLDQDEYRADLKAFSILLMRHLTDLTLHPSGQAAKEVTDLERGDDSLLLDFLTSMAEQLVSPERSLDVSRMVLHVASKYFERSILFMIQKGKATGMAGFGLTQGGGENNAVAKQIVMDLEKVQCLAQVVQTRKALRIGPDVDGLQDSLYSVIDRGRAQEIALLPMLNNREVWTILYGDNPVSGKPLGKLRGVELFLAQAGMALENVFLHRKLRHFESTLSA